MFRWNTINVCYFICKKIYCIRLSKMNSENNWLESWLNNSQNTIDCKDKKGVSIKKVVLKKGICGRIKLYLLILTCVLGGIPDLRCYVPRGLRWSFRNFWSKNYELILEFKSNVKPRQVTKAYKPKNTLT